MRAFLRDTLVTIVVAIVIFLLLQATLQSSIVVGGSMEPNFEDGQRLLINKAVYHFHEPERGDVIVFQQADSKLDYIKRITGLPGESVEIKSSTVYIHKGDKVITLDEPYIKEPAGRNFRGNTIPEKHYFVLGDNRNNSNDSRNDWLVQRKEIIGKVWLSIWPPSQWGVIPHYSLDEQLTPTELLPQLP